MTHRAAREPEEIRRDIEVTRHQLGETVASLAEKADVKAQAKHKLEETTVTVARKKDDLLGRARQASPEGAASLASQGAQRARANPLWLAAGAVFAAGLLIGRLTAANRKAS